MYRGTAHPDLYGRYFFGDECSGRVWDVIAGGPGQQAPTQLLSSGVTIVGWGEDLGGEVYVVGSSGVLYQLA